MFRLQQQNQASKLSIPINPETGSPSFESFLSGIAMVLAADKSVDSFKRLLYIHSLQVDHSVEKWENVDLLYKLSNVIQLLCECLKRHGKIILVGCGKSFKIAKKTVAMLHSLGLPSINLHPTEALHGDVGCIKDEDCLLLCSTSGETGEIITFLEFLKEMETWSKEDGGKMLKKIAVCANPNSSMSMMCDTVVLVPQKFMEDEIQAGLKAPTISTTSMLIVLDCLCLALSSAYYDDDLNKRSQLFSRMHPAGGIGKRTNSMKDTAMALQPPPIVSESVGYIGPAMSELELLRMLVLHDWIVIEDIIQLPSKIVQFHYKDWQSQRGLVHSNFVEHIAETIKGKKPSNLLENTSC